MEIQIQVSAPDKAVAQAIANELVVNRLAACAQIVGPVTSTYWWEEQVESSEEYLLLVKTVRQKYEEVEQAIVELHPYDVPEIISIEIDQVLPAYRNWIREEIATKGKE